MKFKGIKKGMMQLFDDKGNKVVCTVILSEKHVVSQLKTAESDGYSAVQLASFKVKAPKMKNVTKPMLGHFKKASLEPRRELHEVRVSDASQYQIGQEMGVEAFQPNSYVDVQAVSKGKGFQGVMKRYHFRGGPASHGSGFHRHGGSCGMRSTPGRCLPGQKKAGRMGGDTITTQNLRVVRVDADKQIILVEGAIPGSRGGVVYIAQAKKKTVKK